jgi:hypothetical protein
MGNQQPTGRTRSDTYTRYEREGEDGRYVTLEQNDYSGASQFTAFDERAVRDELRVSCSFESLLRSA